MRRVDSTLVAIGKTLERIDARLDKMDAKIDGVRAELKADIKDLRVDIKDVRDENQSANTRTNMRIDRIEAQLWGILSAVVVSIIAQIVLRYI